VVVGDLTWTTLAVHSLLEAVIEICYLSMYGHFRGRLSPPVAKNALLRREQYRAYADPQRALKVAQACVKGKLENMRTLLLRSNRQLQDSEVTDATVAIQQMIRVVTRDRTDV